jgi:hypothetical protein
VIKRRLSRLAMSKKNGENKEKTEDRMEGEKPV